MAGSADILDDEVRLQTTFDEKLDRLCEFYGVPAAALDHGQIFDEARGAISENSDISVELAIVRSALAPLREVGTPKLDFVSESQDEILALRVFFGLDQETVAETLGLPLGDVKESEDVSIVGLQQGISSDEQAGLSDDAVTCEMSAFEVELSLIEAEKSPLLSLTPRVDEDTQPTELPVDNFPRKERVEGEAVVSQSEAVVSEAVVSKSAVSQAVVSQAVGYKATERKIAFPRTRILAVGLILLLLGGTYVGVTRSAWLLNDADEKNQAAATTTTVATTTTANLDPDVVDEAPAVVLGPEDDDEQIDTTSPETTVEVEEESTTSTTEPFVRPVSVNGGFEANVVAAQGVNYYPEIQGWTASQAIEIWSNGHSGVESPGGSHFVELNSTGPNAMVTKINVSPTSVLQWGIDHRGRDGTDAMQVVFTSESGEKQSWLLETGQQWQTYQFEYVVPADSSSITVQLISVTPGSRANLLDNFKISLKQ